MNKPDKAGEPSMEEILASIRQIIADEPAAEPPETSIEANPLVPQSQAAPKVEAPQPLSDRLSNVLKSGPLPPTSPFGSKRPFSFDQDLADMFDEGDAVNGGAGGAPKPDLRVPTGLSHPMSRKSFVPSPPPREEVAKPFTDGAAALPPQLAPSETAVPPPPFGSTERPAAPSPAAGPAPAPSYGFPPLRKTSFSPPQSSAPSAPAPGVRANQPPAGGVINGANMTASPSPGAGATPASLEEALRAARASTAAQPAPEPKPTPAANAGPVLGTAPTDTFAAGNSSAEPAPSSQAPADTSRPASPFAAFAPSTAAPFSPAPTAQATPERPEVTAPASSPAFGSSRPFGAPQAPVDEPAVRPQPTYQPASKPAEPRPFAGPITGIPPESPGYSSQSRFTGGADPTSSAAAHQALDALALGLAASAAVTSASVSPEAHSPAIPLTPIVEPEPAPERAPTPSTLPATVPSYGTNAPPRTLEDAVADMLRPMLQQWVAENMPRIIERALRTEVANTIKPGQKPPGT
ncbi:DUF2497 domain-containing protein [Hyphomicrobium sp. CS1GBMeth3]|uniref:DUF2497 domain-containing protein n=1 Tax=Hyphomicrobium sp. CS1GBMeth3 TaxID=1892845 RepID=UPI000930D553|nr:DUF2497 domain-containing protein [Hyphomicrobium sp. CS1GBMeth3]